MIQACILCLFGVTAFIVSLSSHMGIQDVKRNNFILQSTAHLKIDRATYGFFSFLFFVLALLT
jgi:ABC-type lipoprotein release transport system permease subunit